MLNSVQLDTIAIDLTGKRYQMSQYVYLYVYVYIFDNRFLKCYLLLIYKRLKNTKM